jgi:hypothetical protein
MLFENFVVDIIYIIIVVVVEVDFVDDIIY